MSHEKYFFQIDLHITYLTPKTIKRFNALWVLCQPVIVWNITLLCRPEICSKCLLECFFERWFYLHFIESPVMAGSNSWGGGAT